MPVSASTITGTDAPFSMKTIRNRQTMGRIRKARRGAQDARQRSLSALALIFMAAALMEAAGSNLLCGKKPARGTRPGDARRPAPRKRLPQKWDEFPAGSRALAEKRLQVIKLYFLRREHGASVQEAVIAARAASVALFDNPLSARSIRRWRDKIVAAGGIHHCPRETFIDGKAVAARLAHRKRA